MKTVYGPVPSWRFGRSLGLDPICSKKKTCSFDCIYCQLGKTGNKTIKRKEYVSPSLMKKQLENTKIHGVDVITFSGTGEPTLNSNLGDMISFAKEYGLPVAVLTNSSLLSDASIRSELSKADIVAAKLDAADEKTFQEINKPVKGLHFKKIIEGLREFRKEFKGKFCLQIMFINQNMNFAKEMAELARELKPDEVQLDTPLRPSPVPPLDAVDMDRIEKEFTGIKIISVYKSKKPRAEPYDMSETLKRRPSCSDE